MSPVGRWLVIGGVVVFLSGVLFGRMASSHVYRNEAVIAVVGSSRAEGCSGDLTRGTVFLGSVRDNIDGAYKIACGERTRLSDEVQVVCRCP